jgi:hypothetical protein
MLHGEACDQTISVLKFDLCVCRPGSRQLSGPTIMNKEILSQHQCTRHRGKDTRANAQRPIFRGQVAHCNLDLVERRLP